MKIQQLLLILTCSAIPLFSAEASLVVDWGGDYVSSSQNLQKGFAPGRNDSGATTTWYYGSPSPTVMSPASGYNGTTFYGALQNSRTGTLTTPANFLVSRVEQQAAGDRIGFQSASTGANAADTVTMLGFVTFLKADFLAGGASNAVSLDSTNNLLGMNIASATGGSNLAFRAAILQSGTWYLSDSTFTGATGAKSINMLTANYGSWTPPNGSVFDPLPVTFGTSGSTFTDIQGFGFYLSGTRTGASTGMAVGIDSVEFNATVVPEPSTWALIALAGTFLVVFVRGRSFRKSE